MKISDRHQIYECSPSLISTPMTIPAYFVCRLGGFHVLISYFVSIGHIMAGSGLLEALQCCYGPVAITHLMTEESQ